MAETFSDKIEKICRDFLIENRIGCIETIAQCDHVIINAYEFMAEIFKAYVDNDQLPSELLEGDE